MNIDFKIILIAFFSLLTFNLKAQNGYTLLDSCYDNNDGYVEYSRSFLITTDTGSFQVDQYMGETDTIWTTLATTPFILCNVITTYEATGPVVSVYLNDSSGWNLSRRTVFLRDAFGNLTDSIVQTDSAGTIIYDFKWHREYDASGNIILNETKHWSSGQWINDIRDEWYFDAIGRDTLHISFVGDSLSWIPDQQMRRLFDANGIIDSLSYNWTGTSWNNQYRNQFFYQAPVQDTLELFYTGSGALWDSSVARHRTYDSFGNITSLIEQNYVSPVWENYLKTTYSYDTSNRVVLETVMMWVDTSWENISQTIYNYSGTDAVEAISQSWADTIWICTSFNYYEPSSGHHAEGVVYDDCLSRDVYSDVTERYDSQGHLIYSAFDGHAGQSHGAFHYYYHSDFLYYMEGHSSTMGGLTHDIECYYYQPLTFAFINYMNVCSGYPLQISINGGLEPYVVQWLINDTLVSNTSSDPTLFIPERSGEYSVMITDSINNYFTQSMHINFRPAVDLGEDTVICSDAILELSAGDYQTFLWQDGSTDSVLIALSQGQAADTLIYWVDVMDDYGCMSSDSVSVTFEVCNEILENPENSISVYPNPVLKGGGFTVKSDLNADRIIISNISGRILFELKSEKSGEYKPELEPGVYFMTMFSGEKMFIQKIIVL